MEFCPERGQKIKCNYFAVKFMYLPMCGVDSRTVPHKKQLLNYVWLIIPRLRKYRTPAIIVSCVHLYSITPTGSPEFDIGKFY